MKVSDYQALIAEIGLTEEQVEKITDALDELMRPLATSAHQSRGDKKLETYHFYMNGKCEGLNLAYKFFAGTLPETDLLEHD